MRFFQRFPTLEYRLTETGANTAMQVSRIVPNMTVSLQLLVGDEDGTSFHFYRIKDRDRPDTISAQFYGTTEHAWIVLLANGMRDWYDWPLNDHEFYQYMSRKYESTVGARDGVRVAHLRIHERLWLRADGQRLVIDEQMYRDKIAEGALILSGVSAFDPTEGRDAVVEISLYTKEYTENDDRRLIRLPTMVAMTGINARLSALLQE